MKHPLILRLISLPNWVGLALAVGFSTLYAVYLLGGRHYDLQVPIGLYGDGIFHSLLAKRLISDEGYFVSSVLGFPFESTLYDFPGSDSFSLLFLYIVGKLTSSQVVSINAYYLIGFPLSTLTFTLVARNFGLAALPSAIGGILFAFLPFHFLRINHLYYTWYFVVPLYIWYSWQIYKSGFDLAQQRTSLFWVCWCVGLALLACTGIYYAVFGVTVFVVSGILGSVDSKSFKSLALAAAASASVFLAVLVNVTPNLIYKFNHGANIAVAQRVPQESELYGLKISQLLLPRAGHRNSLMQRKNQTYRDLYPLVNENASASLGLIGSLGFLGLLGVMIFSKRGAKESNPQRYMWVVLIVLLLTATIGGFASLFALFVSPQIRAWNRISVYVAFFSITAAMFALGWICESLHGRRWGRFAGVTLSLSILLVGLWDQTSPACGKACMARYRNDFSSESLFFSKVQNALPIGAAVYVLPFMEFPETPPKHELATYDLAAGYLHTSGLMWSYGAMKGRDQGDSVFRLLEGKPAADQVKEIKALGFSGILIDLRGYPNRTADIESELVSTGKVRLAVKDDARSFYVLTP